jgi:hypothetical protein
MQPENTTRENSDLFGDLSFDHTAKQYLRSIASWAIVIVVVAIISYAISLVRVLTAPELITPKTEGFDFGFKMQSESVGSTVFLILVGLLINYFLLRFATLARTGLNGLNQAALNKSFNNLKVYFIIQTILCILVFLIVILALATASTFR